MTIRRVEHVMGMPISLALHGRHAGDARGDAAWAAALAVLREADRVFSTYRADSVISRINRGEVAEPPPEVAEVLAIGAAAERATGGAFAVRRDGVLDPDRRGRAAAQRRRRDVSQHPSRRPHRRRPHRRPADRAGVRHRDR